MPNISVEIIEVLKFLLPGFITTTVFYSFTSFPKPNAFEQIIYALISTTIIQSIISLIYFIAIDRLNDDNLELLFSTIIAILLGIISSYLMNNDIIHQIFRSPKLKITRESSYPSEWYFAFARYSECYVVLHMHGERRLYGWATEWPSRSDKGHFLIEDGEWLSLSKEANDSVKNDTSEENAILVPVVEVEMVEFLPQVSAKGQRNA